MRRRAGKASSPLSPAARRWRWASWAAAALAASGAVVAVQGLRGAVPATNAVFGAAIAIAGFALMLLCGIQGRKQALDERAQQSSSTLLIALAASLKDKDDATLERLAQQADDAGEVARLILKGRTERLKPRQPSSASPLSPPSPPS